MLFWKYLAFLMIQRMVAYLISGSFAISKSSLNILKFMVHILLKPGLENLEHYFASEWDECNCAVVCALFGIAFLQDWNENWSSPVPWPLLSFPNLLAYWVQHFHSIICQDLKELNWNSVSSTSCVCSNSTAKLLKMNSIFPLAYIWLLINPI